MAGKSNPILKELANQLPESAQSYLYIQDHKDYEDIVGQAWKEFFCLGDMDKVLEDGQSAKSVLQQSGYEKWLDDADEDERLRVLGALKLIAELAEELAED